VILKIFYRDDNLVVIQHDCYHYAQSAIRQRMIILALSLVAEHIPPLAYCSPKTLLKVLRLIALKDCKELMSIRKANVPDAWNLILGLSSKTLHGASAPNDQ
jgi:hypothetical protein